MKIGITLCECTEDMESSTNLWFHSIGDVTTLIPCSHEEEADTHLLLHVADAVQKWFRKVYVCTVDTDVMI